MLRSLTMSRMLREAPLGLLFFALAAFSIVLTRFEQGPAFVWPATALLFGRLSLLPVDRWPAPLLMCIAAGYAASALFGVGPVAGLPLAGIIGLEAAAAAGLLRRWLGSAAYYESPKGVAAFALVAGTIVPAASGALAAALPLMPHGVSPADAWLAWLAAHGLGTLVFAPVFMLAMRGEFWRWMRRATRLRRWEALSLYACVVVVTVAVFMQQMPLLFMPALPIMVATLRLGRAGAALSIMLLAGIGGAYTLYGKGPMTLFGTSDGVRMQFLQGYLAATTLLVLPVAALMRQTRTLLHRLSDSEARYRLLAEQSADAILSVATDDTVLYASPAITALSGYNPDDLVGRNAALLIHDEDLGHVRATRRRVLATPMSTATVEYRAITAQGETRWFETRMRGVTDATGTVTGTVSAVRDVSARKDMEARLSAAAHTDSLTGLPNRRAFMLALEARQAAVREGRLTASLALFDIDWFKAVNDRHGHAAGDAVLIAFAQAARRVLRDGDCLARIGGEEFGLVLEVADSAEAERVCERLRRTLSDLPIAIDAQTSVRITMSAGVGVLRADGDVTQAMRVADAALYRAKADGRDRLVLAA